MRRISGREEGNSVRIGWERHILQRILTKRISNKKNYRAIKIGDIKWFMCISLWKAIGPSRIFLKTTSNKG